MCIVVGLVLYVFVSFSLLLQKVTFDAGPQLQFLFHSDSSNNEWGYKFSVTALGLPDITLSWMSDLQLLVARLMGRLASRTLALKSSYGETTCHLDLANLEITVFKHGQNLSVTCSWKDLQNYSVFKHIGFVVRPSQDYNLLIIIRFLIDLLFKSLIFVGYCLLQKFAQ